MAITTGAGGRRPAKSKATFTLASSLLDEMRAATRDGAAASLNAFVVEAVREKLLRLQNEQRRTLLADAAADPLFLADIEGVQRDFEGTEVPPVPGRRRK